MPICKSPNGYDSILSFSQLNQATKQSSAFSVQPQPLNRKCFMILIFGSNKKCREFMTVVSALALNKRNILFRKPTWFFVKRPGEQSVSALLLVSHEFFHHPFGRGETQSKRKSIYQSRNRKGKTIVHAGRGSILIGVVTTDSGSRHGPHISKFCWIEANDSTIVTTNINDVVHGRKWHQENLPCANQVKNRRKVQATTALHDGPASRSRKASNHPWLNGFVSVKKRDPEISAKSTSPQSGFPTIAILGWLCRMKIHDPWGLSAMPLMKAVNEGSSIWVIFLWNWTRCNCVKNRPACLFWMMFRGRGGESRVPWKVLGSHENHQVSRTRVRKVGRDSFEMKV